MGKEPRGPFQEPEVKPDRKKREKVKKERVHIYISQDCIERIDAKAEQLDLDRSPCIQMLLNVGLNQLESTNEGVFSPRPRRILDTKKKPRKKKSK